MEPFQIRFSKFEVFHHSKKCVVYLKPEVVDEKRKNVFQEIIENLSKKYPKLEIKKGGDGKFHPHLTVGQFPKKNIDKTVEEMQKKWKEIVTTVRCMKMIHRKGNTPFKVIHSVKFAGVKDEDIQEDEEFEEEEDEVDEEMMKYEEKLEDKVKNQLEFYFSDANLSKDKFLRGKIKENKEGFVDLEILVKFNQLKKFAGSVKEVVDCLSKSKSESIVLSKDKTKIKRRTPYAFKDSKDIIDIYVGKFGRNETQERIENYFKNASKKEKIEYVSIRLIRTTSKKEKPFTGGVFVGFFEWDKAKKLLKRNLKYKGQKLTVLTKTKYVGKVKPKIAPKRRITKRPTLANFVPVVAKKNDIINQITHREIDMKLPVVSVVVTTYETNSYDDLFRSVAQHVPDGRVALYNMKMKGGVDALLDIMSGKENKYVNDDVIKELMKDINGVRSHSVLFNWECCGGCSNGTFPTKNTMPFISLLIKKGYICMFGDFSFAALVQQWDEKLLGENPFIQIKSKPSGYEVQSSYQLRFKSDTLKKSDIPQLEVVGGLCADNFCNLHSTGYVFGLKKGLKIKTSMYEFEMLTIATKLDDKIVATTYEKTKYKGNLTQGDFVGAVGHAILRYKSGGRILCSGPHWIELRQIDTTADSVIDVALMYGGRYQEEIKKLKDETVSEEEKKLLIKDLARKFVQQTPSCKQTYGNKRD